jgi:hypothetical protein
MSIASGETIEFTTPYGGPIQLEFDKNDLAVQLQFENIGEHAYWNDASDDAAFLAALHSNDYDWVEVSTPYFEVHSTSKKMISTLGFPQWSGTPSVLAAAIDRYMHNYLNAMGGYQGDGIDVPAEVQTFANAKGWSIDTLDTIFHMTADQPLCGGGCSGNPYDAAWAFNPLNHGDLHEYGHGLEGTMRFQGWDYHATTNHYAFYSQSRFRAEMGNTLQCAPMPFETFFNTLQDAAQQADPAAYLHTNLWENNNWYQGGTMILQMMMVAENQGGLANGWYLRPLLHIMERDFRRALTNETAWLNRRDSYGFSQYTLAEAQAAFDDKNDWLVIAISNITQRDFRDYFDMWGITYSDKARTQIAALGFTNMPKIYIYSEPSAFCDSLNNTAIAIDGTSPWAP